MKFQRQKNIYVNDGAEEWRSSKHAQAPFPLQLDNGLCRVFFSVRDSLNRARPAYIDFDMDHMEVVGDLVGPLFPLGNTGCFDDNGSMLSCVTKKRDRYLMYYIGWSRMVAVPYTQSIGVAVSKDLVHWERYSDGPVLSRSVRDPYYVSMPWVMPEYSRWRMWYISGGEFKDLNGRIEPTYHKIRHAESGDGINWTIRPDPIIVSPRLIARPCVIHNGSDYLMLISERGLDEFRTDSKDSYRLGCLRSSDGITNWEREEVDFPLGDNWDNLMIAYSTPYVYRGRTYIFYNGNGFGQTGIGLAVTA